MLQQDLVQLPPAPHHTPPLRPLPPDRDHFYVCFWKCHVAALGNTVPLNCFLCCPRSAAMSGRVLICFPAHSYPVSFRLRVQQCARQSHMTAFRALLTRTHVMHPKRVIVLKECNGR